MHAVAVTGAAQEARHVAVAVLGFVVLRDDEVTPGLRVIRERLARLEAAADSHAATRFAHARPC